MFIPEKDLAILNTVVSNIGDAIGNIYCLEEYMSDKYPKDCSLEYILYIHALWRTIKLEGDRKTDYNYPIFGKEIYMLPDRNSLYAFIRNRLGIHTVGYLDYTESYNREFYVEKDIHLHEIHF